MNNYINKRSNILIVGSKEKFTLEYIYYKTLRHLGYKVDFLDIEKSLQNRIVAKIKVFLIELNYKILRKKILDFLEKKKNYDLVIFFKGIFLNNETINKIKFLNKKVKFINIFPDNPLNISNPLISNRNFLKTISKFDLFCIWSKDLKKKINKRFKSKLLYLPFAYDSLSIQRLKRDKKKIRDEVNFIGTFDKNRLDLINSIKIKKLIYGGNWLRFMGKGLKNSKVGKHIYGKKIYKIMNESAISLNILRKQNFTSHNMKTFEIPANNGLMLTTRSKEQNDFFKENLACYMYSSKKELNKKIKFILKYPQTAMKVRKYGNSIVKKHSYINRIKLLLKEINKLK